MIDSECSVVVRDQRAFARSVGEPVVPYPGCESEHALSHSYGDPGAGSAAVLFEAELTLEGVVDGLDALANPAQLAMASSLIASIGPYESGSEFADGVLKLLAGVPLVGNDVKRWPQRPALEHGVGNLPVADLGIGQTPCHHRAIGSGEQVQAQTPEVARVRSAVAIVAPVSEVGALCRFPRSTTRHRCRVEQTKLIPPRRGEAGEVPNGGSKSR